jgi:phage baseplate assembly protein W
VELVSAEEDIWQSLYILLSTSLGERVMQPNYGCNLQELLFETLTPTVSSNIKEFLRTAILYHEPRIRLNRLELIEDQLRGIVNITVEYTILSTNSRFSLVYPFYIREGAGSV